MTIDRVGPVNGALTLIENGAKGGLIQSPQPRRLGAGAGMQGQAEEEAEKGVRHPRRPNLVLNFALGRLRQPGEEGLSHEV